MKYLMALLKQKDFRQSLLVTLLMIVATVVYFVGYGIPQTRARNYYNRAQNYYRRGDLEQAEAFTEKSLEIITTESALNLKQLIDQSSGDEVE